MRSRAQGNRQLRAVRLLPAGRGRGREPRPAAAGTPLLPACRGREATAVCAMARQALVFRVQAKGNGAYAFCAKGGLVWAGLGAGKGGLQRRARHSSPRAGAGMRLLAHAGAGGNLFPAYRGREGSGRVGTRRLDHLHPACTGREATPLCPIPRHALVFPAGREGGRGWSLCKGWTCRRRAGEGELRAPPCARALYFLAARQAGVGHCGQTFAPGCAAYGPRAALRGCQETVVPRGARPRGRGAW
jgi:hypothetical protein